MHHVARDWTTRCGLRAVVIECGHFCGYVGISKSHPLYGKHYSDHCECLKEVWEEAKKGPVGDRGVMVLFSLMCGVGDEASPDRVFDVHGSLTFSGGGDKGYPVESDLWWFGFDCSHAGDEGKWRQNMVEAECERLAEQLNSISPCNIKVIPEGSRLLDFED